MAQSVGRRLLRQNTMFRCQQVWLRPREEERVVLTRDFKQTIVERVARDPAFAEALLDEVATLFLNGEPDIARAILNSLPIRLKR